MNNLRPLIYFLAGVGFCALVYGGWHYYQEQRSAAEAQAILSGTHTNDPFDSKTPPPKLP